MGIIKLDALALKGTAPNLLSDVGVRNVNPRKWKKQITALDWITL